MKINKIATAIGLTLALSATANAGVLPDSQKQNDWYSAAEIKLTENEKISFFYRRRISFLINTVL